MLVTVALLASQWSRHEEAAPKAVAEPDLFPFLKPASGVAQPDQGSVSLPQQSSLTPVAAAAEGKRSALAQLVIAQKTAQSLRTQGATEDEVYRMRATTLTAGDADRLAALDRAEAEWQARVSAYLAEIGKLSADPSSNRQQALQQLRNARFSPEEQARLAAYESQGLPHLSMDR